MGHQTTFFMTPKDAMDFQKRLAERTDFLILLWKSPTSAPRIVDSLCHMENGKPWYGMFLARPEDLDQIVMCYIDTQDYWIVQDSPSPVIEFSRSFFEERTLRESRIYYVDKFLNDKMEFEMKPEAFRKWAKMVHSTLKKFLKRRGAPSRDYIGPDAQAWLDAGGGHLETSTGRRVD